ncbi:MAG: hypothetical protein ACRDLA_02530 [Thermoleophilaceae bacterium]
MRVCARGLRIAALLAAATMGCGPAERAPDAAAVAERFHSAVEAGRGEAACAQLSDETAGKLEQQQGRPCREAVLGLDLRTTGGVAETSATVTSASVTHEGEGATFLDEGPDGWRVSAAGCAPTAPDLPYDGELED